MTLLELVILLIIAAVAGSLGQILAGYNLGGCLVSILLGFVGAFVGLWIAREADLPMFLVITVDDESFPLIWAIIGAGIVSLIIGLLTRRHSTA